MKPFTYIATAVAALALAGCTVHQTEAPPLSGPSDLALSVSMTSVPDTLSQDGGSQASIKATAKGPDGKAIAALPFRVEMRAPDASGTMVPQDFGTLSARTVVTGTDGVASVVYTAPAAPVGGVTGTCNGLTGICVEIVMTPTTNSFGSVQPTTTTIRLVPPGVILPPAGTPTASFTITPTPATQGSPVTFDASASTPGNGSTQITSYTWTFGDGSSGSGKTVQHTFGSAATFTVTLTVTNDRGIAASTSQGVTTAGISAPHPDFVFSPSTPTVSQLVVFNADITTAAAGHSITAFNWNFGDGTGATSTATGIVASHSFTTVGTYNVVLSVSDDLGAKATTSKAVTVSSAGGAAGQTTASFSFSPLSPAAGQPVFFNGSSSTAAPGHNVTNYAWDFGDGTTLAGSVATTSHAFSAAGNFNVQLTVTDDTGQKAVTKTPVTVTAASAGSLTAAFTASPTNPTSGTLVAFNGNTSTPLASITEFDWDFGDGTIINGTAGSAGCGASCGMIINHTYNTPANATFTVRLTVHDSSGNTNTATSTLSVTAGTDPVANFTISPNPATVGATVTVNGSASTAGAGAITSYQWNFGDSATIVTGNPATHSYSATGTYTIQLTVTQTNGKTNSTTHTIVIQ